MTVLAGDGRHVAFAVWLSKIPRSVPTLRGTPDTTLSILKWLNA